MDELAPPPTAGRTGPPQKIARLALAAALIGLGAWTLRDYLSALAWAAVIAIGTWPLYQRAERHRPPGRHHLLIPALFVVAVALLFVLPLVMVVAVVAPEAHGAAAWLHEARANGLPAPSWLASLPFGAAQATAWWQANLADPHGSDALLGHMDGSQAIDISRRLGSLVAQRIVLFGFTLLTLFFLFRDGIALTGQMRAASRRIFGPDGERIGQQIVASVRGTVNGMVLVGIGEGALMGIIYAVGGVPHPALFGMFTGIAAMVPLGATLVFAVVTLLLLAQGATSAAIVVLALGVVINSVADHAIRPVLIGGSTRLPFIWVLLGILGGIETWGLLGLFLGPAIMAALILMWREWTS